MKLMFINGALRQGGSTEGIIKYATDYLNRNYPFVEVSTINLCEKQITPCDSCYECEKGICWMEDDVYKIVQLMIEVDAIVYAFPVHAFGVNSLMQTFLERAGVGYLRFDRPLDGKIASIMITGRRYSHEMAWGQVALNVMLNKMILIGSGFPPLIKNDGKKLKEYIQDDEGLTSIMESMDKIVSFYLLKKTNN